MYNRLQLKFALLEPIAGHLRSFESRISHLESQIRTSDDRGEFRNVLVTSPLLGPITVEDEVEQANITIKQSSPVTLPEAYPPPNSPSTDGAAWLTIGSSRYWCKSLEELIRKKKRLARSKKRNG